MDHIHESHAIGSPPSNSPGYLPQYLLGGNSPAISPLPKGRHIGSYKEGPAGQASVLSSPRTNPFHVNSPLRPQGLLGKADKTVPRASPLSCTPKDPIGAPPVEALYDARSSAIMNNSAFVREQVRCTYFSSQFSKFIMCKFWKRSPLISKFTAPAGIFLDAKYWRGIIKVHIIIFSISQISG